MQKTRKPLALLMAALMVVSLFAAVPFTASAADTHYADDLYSYCEWNVTVIKAGDTIISDLSINAEENFVGGCSFTIYDEGNDQNIVVRSSYWTADKDYVITYAYDEYYDMNNYPGYEGWTSSVETFIFHVKEVFAELPDVIKDCTYQYV